MCNKFEPESLGKSGRRRNIKKFVLTDLIQAKVIQENQKIPKGAQARKFP